MAFKRVHPICLLVLMMSAGFSQAASISWTSGIVTGDEVVSNGGSLIEACNFGNSSVSSPVLNGVPFTGIDFASAEQPVRLVGLSYNTGESGKLPGQGINELFDTIAYRSGVNPQTAMLTGLSIGNDYEVQFFYYHNTVDRSVIISGESNGRITLSEVGEPVYATGVFTADATTQLLTFDANIGSQFLNAYQFREVLPVAPLILNEVVISEFMASNDDSLDDGDSLSSDWIEIWNSTTESVDLAGWSLTHSIFKTERWTFPSVFLAPNEFLIVFASGRDVGDYLDFEGNLHTNFSLRKDGGYLALLKPDGGGGSEIASEYPDYPSQKTDVSFGLVGNEIPLGVGYLERSSPASINSGQGYVGFVGDTSFHPDRGFYDDPIMISIETGQPDAMIRYTIDGSEPTLTNGMDYPGGLGIPVTTTTTLRAAAFKEGFKPSNVDTHTYLFVSDVVDQPSDPPGFPVSWTGADYGMEDHLPDLALVAGDSGLDVERSKAIIGNALLELPALSLVMDVDDWFGPANGIYANSTARGAAWERACSVELITPGGIGREAFQIDCGVRVQGNTSRNASANPKHSLRLAFREEYGDSKLRYPFFGEDSPSEFDTIVLRSNSQDGWVYNTERNRMGQFVRDAWARETHRRMGHSSPDGNWVHLFINGLYWGVYNPTERPDAAHGKSHYGGDKENWDAIKNHEEVLDGNTSAYRELLALIQNDPNNWNAGYRDLSNRDDYAAVREALDVEMLIDYMIHNMYAAADDWPGNFYMGYDRSGASGGWRFYDWDNEHGMKNPVSLNRTLPHGRDDDSPTKFHHALRSSPEYRQLFADRLHQAFFNGGVLHVDPDNSKWDPLHPERNVPAALWMELTSEIETALIAESARWGDYRKTIPYTVSNEFESLRNDLLSNWFPERSAVVLSQFQAQGLYPDVAAPALSQFGGVVGSGFLLGMTEPESGAIYYTINGEDPRVPAGNGMETILLAEGGGGRVSIPSSDPGVGWNDVGYDDGSWLGGVGGVGYEIIPADYDPLIGFPVMEMFGSSESVFLRKPFEIADEEALAAIGSLILKMRYDDGFVAYLNGVQVAAANEPEIKTWQSGATESHSDLLAVNAVSFDITGDLNQLRIGENILAIHGLNFGANSSDFLISPQLVAGSSISVGISPSALRYRDEVSLENSGVIRARILDGGEWSALTEAVFVVGTPATAENLVVSEIMYHAEAGKQYDYLELMNVSETDSLQLSGVKFSEGIEYEFPLGSTLLPGERILLVEDLVAFEEHYGSEHSVIGQYSGKLDNGGERLVLLERDGALIRDFSYDDDGSWPASADGGGHSLVLIAPHTLPSHSDPGSWRPSVTSGGNPGGSDATQFTGNAEEDLDGDTVSALLEYALGSSDLESDQTVLPAMGVTGTEVVFSYTRNLAADDVVYHVETSNDLKSWARVVETETVVSSINQGDGLLLIAFLSNPENVPGQFWRLRVSVR
jgi:hypothetical protein